MDISTFSKQNDTKQDQMNLDDREKRRYKARNTTNNKATQGYKTPY